MRVHKTLYGDSADPSPKPTDAYLPRRSKVKTYRFARLSLAMKKDEVKVALLEDNQIAIMVGVVSRDRAYYKTRGWAVSDVVWGDLSPTNLAGVPIEKYFWSKRKQRGTLSRKDVSLFSIHHLPKTRTDPIVVVEPS